MLHLHSLLKLLITFLNLLVTPLLEVQIDQKTYNSLPHLTSVILWSISPHFLICVHFEIIFISFGILSTNNFLKFSYQFIPSLTRIIMGGNLYCGKGKHDLHFKK
jgi:hypothetical protein